MIWNPPPTTCPTHEALSSHLESEILSACGEAAITPERAAEVARGIEAYCAEVAEDATLPSDYLAALVSRALVGAGEEIAARPFARNRLSGPQRGELLDVVMRLRSLPPAVWHIFTSGLIRPSRWLANGDGVTWVLDLSRLRQGENENLELPFLQGVRALLHAVAPIWDADGGGGALGLRSLPRVRRSCRRRRDESVDIRGFCQAVMRRLKCRRGWAAIPQVITLDARAG